MPDTVTYQYYIGTTNDNQKLLETKTANTITYDNLQANTKYIVKVQTKDKMENVGTVEKEITTASPILANEMTIDKENEKIGSKDYFKEQSMHQFSLLCCTLTISFGIIELKKYQQYQIQD